MKKIVSSTVAVIITATPAQALASDVIIDINSEALTTEEKVSAANGKLEVDINFAIPILNTSGSDMKLVLKNGTEVIREIALTPISGAEELGGAYTVEHLDSKKMPVEPGEGVSFIRVIFDKLDLGNYSFELSASGYKTAKVQDIDITNYSKRVRVGTKENRVVKTYGATEQENTYETYPALFLAGDVNSDNIIDMKDYQIVLEGINSNNSSHDLNKDGKVDVADISYIRGSIGSELGEALDYIENTDPIIVPENVDIQVQGAAVEGELKDLLKDSTSTVKFETVEAPSIDNPLKINVDLVGKQPQSRSVGEPISIEKIVIKSPDGEGAPETGNIVYVDGNGVTHTKAFDATNVTTGKSGEQNITIDLGSSIAVKEITIDVTGNRGNKTISEIAKVEFLNNVYKEIPRPIISIPTIKTLETSTNLHDERITISWEPQPNVTGYEVKYYKLDAKGNKVGAEKKLQTNKTNINILDKAIKPYDIFRVSVQALNGNWSSGYAEDLAGKPEDEGGLSQEELSRLIPYTLDGTADNVDENFNLKDEYYGKGDYQGNPKIGSVSDIQVVPLNAPEPPRNLKINEGYRSLGISWENHIHARDFDVYYRKIGSEDRRWIKANDKSVLVTENDETVKNPDKSKLVRSHSYTINGLDDLASYEVKVTATNHLGTSNMSATYIGTTITMKPPKLPNYKVINRPKTDVAEGEIPTENIIDVVNSTHGSVSVDNKFAVVDNDFSTNYTVNDWDSGASYHSYRGPIVEFDKEYTIDRITVAKNQQQGNFGNPYVVRLRGFDADNNVKEYPATISTVKSSNGKEYSVIKLKEPMTVKKLQVNLSVYGGSIVSISEMKFHEADNIEYDLANLYKDVFRLELKEEVTQDHIDDLRTRINTMDTVSLEYNPDRITILKEIDVAEKLLHEVDLSHELKTLDIGINNKSTGPSLGMGNDWQSLGAVARPGVQGDQKKKIVVYVGSDDPNARVQLGFLQTFGSPSEYLDTNTRSYVLSPGRYEITVPEIIKVDAEKGGQVMARVYSSKAGAEVKIRLANVDEIPHLNVNNLINDPSKEVEVKEIIRQYIRDLNIYVGRLPDRYPKSVTGEDRVNNIYTYDPATAVLNNTDIEGDRFTLTMPATEILKGIEYGLNGNEEAKVDRVYNALLAWEQQMQLTYAKKGVYESVEKAPSTEEYELHKAPNTRMNIKYQRMMMGAAGYASGHHVGVGYGGVSRYMQGTPYKFDGNNKVINPEEAGLYGDLIAHEIGHVTDIGSRTYSETSNNLTVALASSMLNQNPSKPGNVYGDLYEKVTSNTKGLSTNRSVVLGMLWQPYLAYEDEDTYEMLFTDNDTDPSNDSYYAKLNRAYRTLTEEEAENADRDQLLIRVSSKVVGKDLSNFYRAHGIEPNEATLKYVSQFPKEERPIQYINDEARRQRISGNAAMAADTELVATFGKDINGNQIKDKSYLNQVNVPLNLYVTKDNDKILGYEILRDGVPVGFAPKNTKGTLTTYNDLVDNVNNRVFTYEAVAYDYNLNATEKVQLGTIKVRHDGSVEKSKIDIATNTIPVDASDYDKHSDTPNKTLKNLMDNKVDSVYEGAVHEDACIDHEANHNEDAYIILDANEVRAFAGIKYTVPTTKTKILKRNKIAKSAPQSYEIQVSLDGQSWTTVKAGEFKADANNPTETIYFDKAGVEGGNQLHVYNTRFVKIIATGSKTISAAELDLIAPPGDNIEIGLAEDNLNYTNGLGVLTEEFEYSEGRVIPKNSIVITGEYRGNPAFNIPLVLNEKEEHIAEQYKGILMADVPSNGNLEEIAEGTWIYWVEPQYAAQFMENQGIFAELYRTDTANGQDGGQRMVSDTFRLQVPSELPEITLSGGQGKARSTDKKIVEIDMKTVNKVRR